jgi:hypothetical protein
VLIDFTSAMEKVLKLKTEMPICFDYIVSGTLYQSFNGPYKIKAQDLIIAESFEGCCG